MPFPLASVLAADDDVYATNIWRRELAQASRHTNKSVLLVRSTCVDAYVRIFFEEINVGWIIYMVEHIIRRAMITNRVVLPVSTLKIRLLRI